MPRVSYDPQPFAAAIRQFIGESGMSRSQFSEKIYGHGKDGKINTAAYALINARIAPNHKTVERIKAATGLDLSSIPRVPLESKTPVKHALQVYGKHHAKNGHAQAPVLPKETPYTVLVKEPTIALKATLPDGSVMLSLDSVSADQAIKVLSALIITGLMR